MQANQRARSAVILVELFVVIGVIAVLIAILLPALSGGALGTYRNENHVNWHPCVAQELSAVAAVIELGDRHVGKPPPSLRVYAR